MGVTSKCGRVACAHCRRPLAEHVRSDAKFCSFNCRRARYRRRQRTARALAQLRRCETCGCRIVLVQKRRDTRFCSPACRQRAYRKRKAAAEKPRKAHQRVIRERLAAADGATARAADIGTARVLPISTAEAAALITPYECWERCLPSPAIASACSSTANLAALSSMATSTARISALAALRLRRQDHRPAARRLYPLGASARSQRADPPVDGSTAAAL